MKRITERARRYDAQLEQLAGPEAAIAYRRLWANARAFMALWVLSLLGLTVANEVHLHVLKVIALLLMTTSLVFLGLSWRFQIVYNRTMTERLGFRVGMRDGPPWDREAFKLWCEKHGLEYSE